MGMMAMDSGWTAKLGSTLASLMFLWAVLREYFPRHLNRSFSRYASRITRLFNPYIRIKIPEYTGNRFKRSEAYVAVQSYLAATCSSDARKLRAEISKNSDKLDLCMDDHEEVIDVFHGVKVWWASTSTPVKSNTMSWYPSDDEKRYYSLTFHQRDRELIEGKYLQHVMAEGKASQVRRRQRKLFTNGAGDEHSYRKGVWSHVPFEHPATFDTIAMDPTEKKEIMEDLQTFTKSKDYYARIGKAWKRGYLLYGPPGTGKSSMVAAMANLLDYDVYDVELTAVKNNTALRKLLIETTGKAVIVIEDIDCSLDLTGKRKKKAEGEDKEKGAEPKMPEPPRDKEDSKVTLSGLLNFIDGLWSSCGGEKIIVFTTNHVEKLDQALIRRGRMDKHIKLSYCGFEAFKVLAKNYIGVEEHALFPRVEKLLGEVEITPADVAECLMPKGVKGSKAEEVTGCLEALLKSLEEIKEKGPEEKREGSEEAESNVSSCEGKDTEKGEDLQS